MRKKRRKKCIDIMGREWKINGDCWGILQFPPRGRGEFPSRVWGLSARTRAFRSARSFVCRNSCTDWAWWRWNWASVWSICGTERIFSWPCAWHARGVPWSISRTRMRPCNGTAKKRHPKYQPRSINQSRINASNNQFVDEWVGE